MDKPEVERKLQQIEQEILTPGRSIEIGWMGVDVKFVAYPKSKGGNLKRGKTWGKITYSNYLADIPISRDHAIEWIMMPQKARVAKVNMVKQEICAMCGRKGVFNPSQWGTLHYLEHIMRVCPGCIKGIYEKSYRPWERN